MTLLIAIRNEERKLEKKLNKAQRRLNSIRAAAKALGHSAGKEVKTAKRVLSPAARARIAAAAKKRWAKVRVATKKAVR